MNILLINSNPVVSRLISLCMREQDIVLEEVENVGDVAHDRYSVVFVDDRSYDDETKRVLSNLMIRKKVFLSSTEANEEITEQFDTIIKKPFLPSQIRAVLKSMEGRERMEEVTEMPSIFPLASENDIMSKNAEDTAQEEIDRAEDTNVLDSNEIEKIKALLEMDEDEETKEEAFDEAGYEARKVEAIKQQLEADGLEIISEEEYVETLSEKVPKEKKEKSMKSGKKSEKKSKKSKKDKEAFTFEEALITAVEGMKIKKIKKLLKDAEVTIKIDFKDKK
ncbi:hypothetical protein [Sulfurovum sp.]|uniref:hypothetical protein n=1 Tax=Sulfurovum sp. TaxID=1969726 RepID=UPI0025E711F6|nr:hypothetical protein [Sulfurovum sp.]